MRGPRTDFEPTTTDLVYSSGKGSAKTSTSTTDHPELFINSHERRIAKTVERLEKVGKIAGRAGCHCKGLYKDGSFPWKKKKRARNAVWSHPQ